MNFSFLIIYFTVLEYQFDLFFIFPFLDISHGFIMTMFFFKSLNIFTKVVSKHLSANSNIQVMSELVFTQFLLHCWSLQYSLHLMFNVRNFMCNITDATFLLL